ncbi:MAG: recombinase family protein [Cyanomargarita calcarea GSE-NOS-MK-12-04C]|jgi:DNA invertase Pin-like site-specific DNA recombinase|uniref:Recombinase family protein n=1 Tax=Cyanomargarita calcarea GSE-NOS-MK-12-04C TaxID=2839659 RepID=A0A951QK25_9CYAN|nr:recombinase family protein [Cyanomargarita calcarea GSE-NOS-MK-12-04C]
MQDLSKALGYCRVSTQRQCTEGHGLERYIDQLKRYGLTDEQIHWDIESGASETRRGYNKVLELVRSRQIKTIVVPCFDRFTRSALGWEKAREELQKYEVELLFLDGGSLDLETPEGVFTSRILAAMAAQVRDKNKYNALQGAKYFRSQRKIYKAIFGFEKNGDTVRPNFNQYRDTNKTCADVARECIDIFLKSGELTGTIRRLVEKYGSDRLEGKKYQDFSRDISTFGRWLSNPQLCGLICYYPTVPSKTQVVESGHQGIISVEKFELIQKKIAMGYVPRSNERNNPLCGIAWCETCQLKMVKNLTHARGKVYEYLRCCNCGLLIRLEIAIAYCIKTLTQKAELIANSYPDEEMSAIVSNEAMELQRQILDLKRKNDLDLEGAIKAKEQRLEAMLRSSEVETVSNSNRAKILKTAAATPGFWEEMTRHELTVLFYELIDKIVCASLGEEQAFAVSFKI